MNIFSKNKNETIRRIAIYLRVSTSKQAEEGYSLDAQLERCKAYCIYRGINLDLVDIYREEGKSAKNLERPVYQELEKKICMNVYSQVIVFKLDRLTRSIGNFVNILEMYADHDTGLVSVSEDLDLGTIMGRLIAKILVVFAEMERELTSERTKVGFHGMAEQGIYPFGGKTPMGYNRNKEGRLIANSEKDMIIDLFTTYLKLRNIERLRIYARNHYPGYLWGATKLRVILSNRTYLGGIYFRKTEEWYPDRHERFISNDVFDEVQLLLASRSGSEYIYLYRNIAYCSRHHVPLELTSSLKNKNKYYLYYKCPCCKKMISERYLDDFMYPYVFDIYLNSGFNYQENKNKIEVLQKSKQKNIRKQKELMHHYLSDRIDISAFERMNTSLKESNKKIENEIQTVKIEMEIDSYHRYNSLTREEKAIYMGEHVHKINIDLFTKTVESVDLFEN